LDERGISTIYNLEYLDKMFRDKVELCCLRYRFRCTSKVPFN